MSKFYRKSWVETDPTSGRGFWANVCVDPSYDDPFPVRAHRASRLVRTFRIGGPNPDTNGFGSGSLVLTLRIPLLRFDSFREDVLKFYMQSDQGASDLLANVWLTSQTNDEAVLLKSFNLVFERTTGSVNIFPRHGIPIDNHFVASVTVDLDRPLYEDPDNEFRNRQLEIRIDLVRPNLSVFASGWKAILDVAQL